ncbi:MAG TPA: DPP IV N-terminal domain-containing protein, partial [Pyrinomonadaceae bacterium]|nr:DPP IV N-terminal domain-containing protein [Pyrinomonadaceae bacterium]
GAVPTPTHVELGPDPDFYLARVDWFPSSHSLAIQKQSRDQKTLTLLKADATSGATRELLVEHSDSWVDLNDELTFLERSARFIWASTRTGFKHLYLYDDEGQLIRPLTSGDWVVEGDGDRAIRGVDEQRGTVYFMANAQSPLERHLYSLSLTNSKSGMARVTESEGWHSVKMSNNAKVFLDTYSTPDAPPSVTLRSANGKAITTLVANAITGDHPYVPYLSEHVSTEFGTLKANDG